VSSWQWAVGALTPTARVLHLIRVVGTTVVLWLLGFASHPSWTDVRQLQIMRHVTKLWMRTFLLPWDVIAARSHWNLVGHMSRSAHPISHHSVQWSEVAVEVRVRARTGPDNSGVRAVHKFVQRAGEDFAAVTSDRQAWAALGAVWLAEVHGLTQLPERPPVVHVVSDDHMLWHARCWQGVFRGSVTWFVQGSAEAVFMSRLCRTEGWQHRRLDLRGRALCSSEVFVAVLLECLGAVASYFRHLRVVSNVDFPLVSHVPDFQESRVIVEYSCQVGSFPCDALRMPLS
jgi:hypothetical protein